MNSDAMRTEDLTFTSKIDKIFQIKCNNAYEAKLSSYNLLEFNYVGDLLSLYKSQNQSNKNQNITNEHIVIKQ